jgi:hypothetical protein
MRVLPLLFVALATAASGLAATPFANLACTDDGSQVYFATNKRLKAEAPLHLPETSAIYRVVQGRVERLTEPPPFDYYLPESDRNPQVSGDGRVFSYTHTRSCVGGSSCIFTFPPYSYSRVFVDGELKFSGLEGSAQISRNGRYVLNFGWHAVPGGSPPLTVSAIELTELRIIR